MQQHRLNNRSNTIELSAFKSDTKLVKMEKDRKKAVIAKLQNYQRKDVRKQYEEEYYDA